jgi:hypothetical protein
VKDHGHACKFYLNYILFDKAFKCGDFTKSLGYGGINAENSM